jgi:hypothetical protein
MRVPPQWTYGAMIDVRVDGTTAVVSGFCPGGDGIVTLSGSGVSMFWDGRSICEPVIVDGCTTSVTITGWHLTLWEGSGDFTGTLGMTVSRCDLASSVIATFKATERR